MPLRRRPKRNGPCRQKRRREIDRISIASSLSSYMSRYLQHITEEYFDYLMNSPRLMRQVRRINWIRWGA
jgi:hypothetical protein